MRTNFTLNGTPIKRPSNFKISRFRLTKSGRLASGLMTMENIARKRKFFFTYAAIDANHLNVILDLIWETNEVFFTLGYIENNVNKTCMVYVGEIPSELFRTDDANWVWKDVTFDLIEQ